MRTEKGLGETLRRAVGEDLENKVVEGSEDDVASGRQGKRKLSGEAAGRPCQRTLGARIRKQLENLGSIIREEVGDSGRALQGGAGRETKHCPLKSERTQVRERRADHSLEVT